MAHSTKFGMTWITSQVALKKSIPIKWWNGIPPSIPLDGNAVWHKHKAQKEATFLDQ